MRPTCFFQCFFFSCTRFWFHFFWLGQNVSIYFLNINFYYNIASKFVSSNSITRVCFLFLMCTFMTSANKSLEKKKFHRVENVIKQLVHESAVHSSGYEVLGKFGEHSRSKSWLCLEQLLCIFCALQTSRMLHISMNVTHADCC